MSKVKYLGQNVSAVKSQNVKAILMSLLYNEPIFRVDLAKEISVSTTTVSKLIDELIRQGFVYEGPVKDQRQRSVGRPKSAVFLNRDACFAVGIHIGGRRYRIGIVNLLNEDLAYYKGTYDYKNSWEVIFPQIAEDTRKIIAESGVDKEQIIGVGIGVPGLVDFEKGSIGYSKNHNWRNVPVKDYFEEQLNLPVVVENNVRAMALGEALFGEGRSVDNLLFIYGSRGVGAGLVVDRKIFRGISQGAGEIGHMYIIHEDGAPGDRCQGKTLEELISIPAICAEVDRLIEENPHSQFSEILSTAEDNETPDALYNLVKQNNPQAVDLMGEISRYLGLAIVNAINFINPELILLGGIFSEYSEFLLPSIRGMANDLTFANIGKRVDIRPTNFGWRSGLYGASALALAHFFYLPPDHSLKFLA